MHSTQNALRMKALKKGKFWIEKFKNPFFNFSNQTTCFQDWPASNIYEDWPPIIAYIDNSERPNQLKLSSAEPRSFGQIHRSFGRSFGRISGHKWRKNWQIFSKKIWYISKEDPFNNWIVEIPHLFGTIGFKIYFLIGTKMKFLKYHINFGNIPKKITWNRKNDVFCWFGGSADFTEASAELFRPILTEASAVASVSVVHYSQFVKW